MRVEEGARQGRDGERRGLRGDLGPEVSLEARSGRESRRQPAQRRVRLR